jgi:hypothetical protein
MTAPREISLEGCTRAEPRQRLRTLVDAAREEQIEQELAKIQWQWIQDDGEAPDPNFQEQTEQLRAAVRSFGREEANEAIEKVLEKVLDEVLGPERPA